MFTEDFYKIQHGEDSKCCSEGLHDIREGIHDIRKGIKDLNEGLDEIRKCQVRDGCDDLRDGMRETAEGVKDILEGLRDLGINRACGEYCEIIKDIREIYEGLEDVEQGIEKVEHKHHCECEHRHSCENCENHGRETQLRTKEKRRCHEGVQDIREGIHDVQVGFNDLVDDLRELFFIADERYKYSVNSNHNGNFRFAANGGSWDDPDYMRAFVNGRRDSAGCVRFL